MNAFWWLVGTLGIGGTILAVLAFFGFWPLIIGTKVGRFALGFASLGVAGVWFYLKARADGARIERERQERENADFIHRVAERDAELAVAPDAELDRLLGHPPKGEPGSSGGNG